MVINLDPTFNPFVSDAQSIPFESFTFPGGEPHIRITTDLSQVKEVYLSHRIRSFSDMGLLLVCMDAVRRAGVAHIHLHLPYFPGARQDRVMTPGESLTVKVYADLLNASGITSLHIFDPHSEVTPALLNNCHSHTNHTFIARVMEDLRQGTKLISPDAGALKKIYRLASFLQISDIVECGKSRNVITGELSGFTVGVDDLNGADCLIIDDICDGGGTFLGLASELKKKNAGKLYLAISHGIFSNGLEQLTEIFEKIYCTDSFQTLPPTPGVIQVPMSKINY